ncbi:MAG TPA: flagellar biosynthetic protein FliO [Desulfosporosinus sp.]|nr:flagellar biosynthetic protein FliO [Desulfosporosinus sp.]
MSSIEDQAFPTSGAAPAATTSAFPWAGLMGTLLVLVFILLLSLWIMRRLKGANGQGLSAPWARVLDRQVLGGQQSLYLVEIAGQLQVLGGSDHHLLKISEINDPDVAAEILEEIATRPIERVDSFTNSLQKLWPRRSPKKESFAAEMERLLDEVKE